MQYVRMAAETIAQTMDHELIIINKSTVPVGTGDWVADIIRKHQPQPMPFCVVSCPEFLREGSALADFMSPDRVVLGSMDKDAAEKVAQLHLPLRAPIMITDLRTAEMIKYASNALLATLISFSNELANLGVAIGGIDTVDVSRGLELSRYLSMAGGDGERRLAPLHSFLLAGCGFGGSCLPKDVAALVAEGRRRGLEMGVLDAVLRVNARQPFEILRILERHFPDLSGRRVSVLGLAFRPDTDDMRESPAIPIVRALLARGARVRGYDPVAGAEARKLFGAELPLCATLEEALRHCDAAVLVTRWREFEALPELLAGLQAPPLLVDGRRMLDKARIERYDGIGL
jgi:UDPglucose 6-dehydrogenase/GDP-mannose 6-dehydrogenase